MTNQELAEIFERIGGLLEIKGENIYKILAYRRAAESLRNLSENVNAVWRQGRLMEIPGVGKAIADKIDELLTTGRLEFLEKLEQEVPPTLIQLLEVPDVGPKKAALFWKEAGITNLADLEAAARAGRLRHLPGVGEKSEQRILAGIESLARRSDRMLLGTGWPIARRWIDWLVKLPAVQRADAAGSLRRWRATIGDLDLVAASDQPEAVVEALTQHPDVRRVLGQGENKNSVELNTGLKMQLWIQPPERYGALLQFATGSKDHNVRLRELAQRQKLSLSERGLTDEQGKLQLFSNEEKLYAALGLPWIPPELREDRGEIEAALQGTLPRLVERADLLADLHTHSDWSDGHGSIRQMAEAARQAGLKVLAITDHSGGLGVTGGLDVERLQQQREEIQAVQRQMGDSILLLQGSEVEIRADGSLDYPDEVLARLDVVVASIHTSLRQPREVITKRLLHAMSNPHVDIIGHPSGRLLPNREGAELDWDAVLEAARRYGVALEIDSHPQRLDLDEIYARRAGEMGIWISIDSDAHAADQFELLQYGVSVARRAWLGAEQVISAWPVERLRTWLQQRGERRSR